MAATLAGRKDPQNFALALSLFANQHLRDGLVSAGQSTTALALEIFKSAYEANDILGMDQSSPTKAIRNSSILLERVLVTTSFLTRGFSTELALRLLSNEGVRHYVMDHMACQASLCERVLS